MTMNVYNIIWADDEIDDILDDYTIQDLEAKGFKIVGIAHDGEELEALLSRPELIDAVIVDANFNESGVRIESERDTSGLDYARSLYTHRLDKKIPFFLFTNRSDELLKEIYKHNKNFLADFPRYKRWFKKSSIQEYNDMLNEIKSEVDKTKSSSFIIRNKYKYELNAASIIDKAEDFVFEFLTRDIDGTLDEIIEPFIRVRRIIEKIFWMCDDMKLIPPISDNTNGTAAYFVHNKYRIMETTPPKVLYVMTSANLMAKPLAYALKYIVDITQDAAHSKSGLKLKVDEYFEEARDVLLLKSVVFILMDVIKWFAITALSNKDPEENEATLWHKCE